MLKNIPMDPKVLSSFLRAGFLETSQFNEMLEGIPQGSPLSPIVSNFVLDGLQAVVEQAAGRIGSPNLRESIMLVRYADDFIIMGLNSKLRSLFFKTIVAPVEAFLKERGLSLSKEKTKFVDRKEGFTFLGY
jgi:RNA-directed DNA polymerase